MKTSAGILPYRTIRGFEVLIAHPGGPFFAGKDSGSWSLVKGELDHGEAPLQAALREFTEETGWVLADGSAFIELGSVVLRSRKVVLGWGVEADFSPAELTPGLFELKWHGRTHMFPEIDRVVWAQPTEAKRLLNPAQNAFVDRLEAVVMGGRSA